MSGIKKVLVIIGIALACAALWVAKNCFGKEGAPDYVCCPADDPDFGGDGNVETDNAMADIISESPADGDVAIEFTAVDIEPKDVSGSISETSIS